MKVGFMINSLNLIDNAKALIESGNHEYFVMAINDIYDEVKDLFPNVYKVVVSKHRDFPFVDKVCAAAKAEELGIEIWMDIDSLFLKEVSFDNKFYVAPVDVKNIGASELNEFWSILYDRYDIVPKDKITTRVTKECILPYFNFGFVVNFKHYSLLKEELMNVLDSKLFEDYYSDYLYKIFLHQAIFTSIVLKHYDVNYLPNDVNYPLHVDLNIENVKSIRYDTFFNDGKKLSPYTDKYDLTIDWIYS